MADKLEIETFQDNLIDSIENIKNILNIIFPKINFYDKKNLSIDPNDPNDPNISVNLTTLKYDNSLTKKVFLKICERLSFLITSGLIDGQIQPISINNQPNSSFMIGFPITDQKRKDQLCQTKEVQEFQKYIYFKIKLYYYLSQITGDKNQYIKLVEKYNDDDTIKQKMKKWIENISTILNLVKSDKYDVNQLENYVNLFEKKDQSTVELCQSLATKCEITNSKTICKNNNILSVIENVCKEQVDKPKKENPVFENIAIKPVVEPVLETVVPEPKKEQQPKVEKLQVEQPVPAKKPIIVELPLTTEEELPTEDELQKQIDEEIKEEKKEEEEIKNKIGEIGNLTLANIPTVKDEDLYDLLLKQEIKEKKDSSKIQDSQKRQIEQQVPNIYKYYLDEITDQNKKQVFINEILEIINDKNFNQKIRDQKIRNIKTKINTYILTQRLKNK
jgi:hypothetical protein